MARLRLLTVLLATLVAVNVSAQTVTGSLSGTVVDGSTNVVPGADVTIVNEGTGEERHGLTSEVGDFIFPALVPGKYTVRVKLQGFKAVTVAGNVVLANGRTAVGRLKLELGELNEQITVTATGETLKTTTTAHQAVLDLTQVTNLSIRGRDPISLLKVLPGVGLLANDQETFGGSFATAVPAIQGSSTRGQTIYVDGINRGGWWRSGRRRRQLQRRD